MTAEEKVEFEHRLTAVEHRGESNTRRVEKLEYQTEAIQSLAKSVEVMVTEQGHQTEAIERIEKNVEKLGKPNAAEVIADEVIRLADAYMDAKR